MTRPRLALVTPRYPPDVGGLENYAAWVSRTMRARGWDVVVLTTHPGRETLRETDEKGMPIVRLGTRFLLSNTPMNLAWPLQLRRLMREFDVDVVNAHAPVPVLADLAAVVCGRRPVVITYHSGSMVKGAAKLVDLTLRTYERVVLPAVFRRADRLIGVSPVALTAATGRDVTIPPGVDIEVFRPPPEQDQRDASVVYVGRVELASQWKGLHVLIDAFAQVADRVPRARLLIAGDGDAAPVLRERAAALGIADRIDWLGFQSHVDLSALLRRAGVVALPSLTESESFGMALIEAMASGCPVVGSDVGGIPYVVRDGVDGLLVPPGSASALADSLIRVLTDGALARRLGQAGREAAEQRWDWSLQAEHTARVMEDLLSIQRRRAGLKEQVRAAER